MGIIYSLILVILATLCFYMGIKFFVTEKDSVKIRKYIFAIGLCIGTWCLCYGCIGFCGGHTDVTHHVRTVDGVDAQQQGRAISRRRVAGLLGEEGRLIGLNVGLLEAPLHGIGLAPVELRRARPVAVREPVVDPHRLGQLVRRFQHRAGRGVEQIPHRGAAEEEGLLLDEDLRRRVHQPLRLPVLLRHRVQVGEEVQRVHQVPLAQKLRLVRRRQQAAHALHLRVKFVKGAARVERVAQAQQGKRVPLLRRLRAFAQHRPGQLGVGNAVEALRNQTAQRTGQNRRVVPGAVIAGHGLPRRPAFLIDRRRGAQHLPPEGLVRLPQAAAQKGGQQLVGIEAPPRLPVEYQRRTQQKLRQRLLRQAAFRDEGLQGLRRELLQQAQTQHRLPLRVRQLLPEGGGEQLVEPLRAALRHALAQVFQIQRHRGRPAVRLPVDGAQRLRRERNAKLPRIGGNVGLREQQIPAADVADAALQRGKHVPQPPKVLGEEHRAQAAPAALGQRVEHLRLPALQGELEIVEHQRQRLGGAEVHQNARRLLRIASVEVA